MNIQTAKSIPVQEVLKRMGFTPQRSSNKDAFYTSPFNPAEKSPSFHVSFHKNVWHCFSTGLGGNTLDLVLQLSKCTVKDALVYLEDFNFLLSSSFQPPFCSAKEEESTITVNKICSITSPQLKRYLSERGIGIKNWEYIKEIHFTNQNKNLYAIGFPSLSNGWELRNAFYKGSILKKDISIIEISNSDTTVLFEGFIDALSYKELYPNSQETVLVLNSISLLERAKLKLSKSENIKVYFDNDLAGKRATENILNSFPNAKDCSSIYTDLNLKDLNDYLKILEIKVTL